MIATSSSKEVCIYKAFECKSLLEFMFCLKEELVRGITFISCLRNQVSCDSELDAILSNDHFYHVTEDGVAYSILDYNYYNGFLYKEIRLLNTDKFYQFIKDNADRIDKLYKMKAFI